MRWMMAFAGPTSASVITVTAGTSQTFVGCTPAVEPNRSRYDVRSRVATLSLAYVGVSSYLRTGCIQNQTAGESHRAMERAKVREC
jgi:hypothetical protein